MEGAFARAHFILRYTIYNSVLIAMAFTTNTQNSPYFIAAVVLNCLAIP